jgi:hypothetical protein
VERDEWGRSSEVQSMRRVFSKIEDRQSRLLGSLGIASLDRRLREWRRTTLSLFENAWAESSGRGERLNEESIVDLYLRCLVTTLRTGGFAVPEDPFLLSPDKKPAR